MSGFFLVWLTVVITCFGVLLFLRTLIYFAERAVRTDDIVVAFGRTATAQNAQQNDFDDMVNVEQLLFQSIPDRRSYLLPPHCGRVLQLWVDNRGVHFALLQTRWSELPGPSNAIGFPTHFWVESGRIHLWPTPDGPYVLGGVAQSRETARQEVRWHQLNWHNHGQIEQTLTANRKSEALLKQWLTPTQLIDYETRRHFLVKGSHGGTYRINRGTISNVERLNPDGTPAYRLCVQPNNSSAKYEGDVMLAQKIALETDEPATLKVANVTPLLNTTVYADLGDRSRRFLTGI